MFILYNTRKFLATDTLHKPFFLEEKNNKIKYAKLYEIWNLNSFYFDISILINVLMGNSNR
jgi:hypothetical protein